MTAIYKNPEGRISRSIEIYHNFPAGSSIENPCNPKAGGISRLIETAYNRSTGRI